MFQDPDLDVKYRKGGKIMKKPSKFSKKPIRKFSEGGEGVDWVPQTKYKNLGDFFRGKKMEDEPKAAPTSSAPATATPSAPAAESDADKAIKASKAADIPSFAEASSYGSQAAQDADKGIKGGEHVVTEVKKEAPKAAAPKRSAPKAAPRKAAPSPRKAGNDPEPYVRREEQTEPQIRRDYGVTGRRDMHERRSSSETGTKYDNPRFAKPETDPSKMSDMDRYFHNKAKKDAEERKAKAERLKLESQAATAAKGFAVYKKGGGVESKGKTQGKIVKMAKGGSIRGYGISKVTNKTKYF